MGCTGGCLGYPTLEGSLDYYFIIILILLILIKLTETKKEEKEVE